MKKMIKYIGSPLLVVILFSGSWVYIKFQEKNPDYLLSQALKKKMEHSEFFEIYGEEEPRFPDKEINTKTLLGIDELKNGIRDDVDIWINRTSRDQNEGKAARQYARANQAILNHCEANALALLKAEMCLSTISDYIRDEHNYLKNKLDIITFNTESRKDCYKKAVKTKIELNEASDNFYCDFEIRYKENVIFGNADWKKRTGK